MLIASVTRVGRFVRVPGARPAAAPHPAQTIPLIGIVAAGDGVARHFTSIDWVVEQCRAKLGFAPHPGTLNLRMRGAYWQDVRARLAGARGIAFAPPGGACGAKCFPLRLAGRIDGALVLPDVADYPADKLEIVAPLPVRAALGLADGDRLALTLDLAAASPRRLAASLDARTAPRTDIAWLTRGQSS